MIISENIADLVTALAKAQGAIENASKSSINPHFRSSYATLADVREVIREPLATNGLSIVQGLRTVNGGIEVETILFHASGQSIRETLAMQAGKGSPQDIGSASSYARRYGVMAMLGLAAEDDDGNAATASQNGKEGTSGVRLQIRGADPISPAQAEEIRQAIVETAADLKRFLATFNIQRIEEMPAGRFPEAMRMLEIKRQQTAARDEAPDA